MIYVFKIIFVVLPGLLFRVIARLAYIIWNFKDEPAIMYFYRNKYEVLVDEDYKANLRTYDCTRFEYRNWWDWLVDDDSRALRSFPHKTYMEIYDEY